MNTRIALVGDFVPGHVSLEAACAAVRHAADHMNLAVDTTWISTSALETQTGLTQLTAYDAIFLPGGDFHSKAGALASISQARELGWPFFAT